MLNRTKRNKAALPIPYEKFPHLRRSRCLCSRLSVVGQAGQLGPGPEVSPEVGTARPAGVGTGDWAETGIEDLAGMGTEGWVEPGTVGTVACSQVVLDCKPS